ncbi:phage major tail tube protein [Thalassospira marina]|uniref:Phage major tail tube protein n=1 Tax=Thalassospira marina TaxID=2048283 RepID=A0A2N3KWW2_9PROT|nr:phage major tail tube protein [Thalassospira marina]PKR55062.1 phage major tail tube protein [Thalassospira marina]
MLPKILKNFNIIIDGIGMVGLAEEVVLPVLERDTEEFRGGGMLGPVELDLGMNAMKLEATIIENSPNIIKAFGLADASGVQTRFLGAQQADDSSNSVTAIEVSVRGRWKKIDMGTVKGGDLAKMKIELPITYYKYTANGDVLVEIDLVNGKEVIGSVDRQQGIMQASGITGS